MATQDQTNLLTKRTYLQKWLAEVKAMIVTYTTTHYSPSYVALLRGQVRNIESQLTAVTKQLSGS